jgi:multisubunit Na+/H+ antiporter MnhB subunit
VSTLILRATARLLTPLVVVLAVYLLLRAADAPGGGFIAGLVAGLAVVLRYFAHGAVSLRRLLGVGAQRLIGVGLLVLVLTGIGGFVGGGHFLEAAQTTVHLPVVGSLQLSSALVFETGVFLLVLAVVVAVVQELGGE